VDIEASMQIFAYTPSVSVSDMDRTANIIIGQQITGLTLTLTLTLAPDPNPNVLSPNICPSI